MTEHVFDEIPRLLSGDADRATVYGSARHLRTCEDCREELVSALVAHASLMSAVRYAPDIVRQSLDGPAVEPGAAVSELPAPDVEPLTTLPDLSAIFAKVRNEARVADDVPPSAAPTSGGSTPGVPSTSSVARLSSPHRRTHRAQLAVAAAAAGVVVLGGGGVYLHERSTGPTQRTIQVGAFEQGHVAAEATMVGDNQVKLNASSLPALAAGSYYEVWLTDAGRTNMAAVGQLDSQGKGTYTVTPSTITTYSAIEVSVQKAQSDGSYSGVSVLRGSYR